MAAASARRRAIGALTLIGACFFTAAPAAAADGDEPIPLTDSAITGLTADIDGDGAREIVILSGGDDGNPVMVELWAFADARWSLVGREDVLRRSEDGRASAPVGLDTDGVGLLVLEDGPIERPLVVTVGEAMEGNGCCLTISEVVVESGGSVLRTAPGAFGDATLVSTIDVEGDGRDELLVTAGDPYLGAIHPDVRYRLLRRSDDGTWATLPIDTPEDAVAAGGMMIVDTDGAPGEELVLQNGERRIFRFSASGAGMALDGSILPGRPGVDDAWLVGVVGGELVLGSATRVMLGQWPRGGELRPTRELDLEPDSYSYVVGSGDHARLATAEIDPASMGMLGVLHIHGLDLEVERALLTAPTQVRLMQMIADDPSFGERYPFAGPIAGGTSGGDELYVIGGWLVTLTDEGTDVEPVGTLAGTTPLGLAGPDDAWVLTGVGFVPSFRNEAALYAGFGSRGPMTAAPRSAVFAPDPQAPLDVTFDGAVELGWSEDGARRIAAASDFSATLSATPGTTAWLTRDGIRIFRDPLLEERTAIEIKDSGADGSEENGHVTFEVIAFAPTGQVTIETWEVDFLRVPPEVSAEAEVESFALEASVSGTASPGTTLTVDGAPVEVDADGRFTATVDAPIWPREVVVTATDPVGNASTTRLEIVGFVDYRGWPWPVLIGLVTVVGGVLMYLRAPRWVAERAQQAPAPAFDDDARLEELDPDRA